MRKQVAFDLDEALDTIDLTFNGYVPSEEALEFFLLMRLVTGEDFEFNTPLNWNPSFQFASLSSDLANRLHK